MSRKQTIILACAIAVIAAILATVWLRWPIGDRLFDVVRERNVARLRSYLDRGADPNMRNELGMTPLHYAAAYGYADCVRLLLEAGGDASAPDNWGNTPVHHAAIDDTHVALGLLVEHGGANLRNAEGETPLHLAASHMAREAARVLLSNGAEVDARNTRGRTALFLAVEWGDTDMIALLVAHGADVSAADLHGKTPLDVAEGQPRMKSLLERHVRP